MSLTSSMNIAQQALTVSQAAISVVSNNIANVDSEGYSKLRVNTAGVINNTPSAGNKISIAESAAGVTIDSVQRYSDTYLQSYFRQESSVNSYLGEYSGIASNIQDLTNELNGTGLSNALSDFYLAANTLSSSPTDISARENYAQSASNVATVFNTTAGDLNNLKRSLVGDSTIAGSLESSKISSTKDDVNNLLDEVAKVNYDIIRTGSANTSSNKLLDKRDQLLNKLAKSIPIVVSENPNGTVNLKLGDIKLVQGSSVKGYLDVASTGVASNPVVVNLVDSSGTIINADITNKITSGSMGAILDSTGSSSSKLTINGILDKLNTLAKNFAKVLNDAQTGDPNGDGTVAMSIDAITKKLTVALEPIYKTNDGSATITAGNIVVNQSILDDPYKIAAARVTPPTAAQVDNVGNNSNVNLVLSSRSVPIGGAGGLGDLTVEGFLSGMVAKVGSGVERIDNNLQDQTLVLNQIQTNLKSKTGVNLDEEMVDLIKFQRAYQASARVFSVCNSLLGELVNLGK